MMKKLLFILLIGIYSCTSPEVKKLQERQVLLEGRIEKLEKEMKEQIKIDSILLEFQKPQPGSLLYELDNSKK